MAQREKIGFIGLGAMGRGMAANCVRKGFDLTVCDVNPEPVAALVKLGAKAARTPADVAKASSIVITVLPTGREVDSVVLASGGVMDNLGPGSLILDLSTIDPETTDRPAHSGTNQSVVHVRMRCG